MNTTAMHLLASNVVQEWNNRDFKFENFVAAFSFITSVAMEAEKMDHHPEWNNVYNQVTIALNTHSAGGITQLDFDLASKIDNLYKKYQ